MSSFSLKNNLTVDNNKYISWLNLTGDTRYSVLGVNTNNNLIITSPNDIYLGSNVGSSVYTSNLTITNKLTATNGINLFPNTFMSNPVTSDSGFIGIAPATSGSATVLLYGNSHLTYPGNVYINSSSTITNSSLFLGNGTTNSLSITNGLINLNNNINVNTSSTTLGNIALFSNSTNSTTTTNGSVVIIGGVGINGNININGVWTSYNTSTSTNSTSASVVLNGGVSINNTTIATSITCGGALTVAGGIAINKNALIGGNVTLYNASSTASTSSFNANLVIYGGLGINDAVFIRSSNQLNLAPTINNNPTNINFFNNNNFTGSTWVLGQSNGNFIINNGTNGNSSFVFSTSGNFSIANNGSFFNGSFIASNNVSSPTNVNGFILPTSSIICFTASVIVIIVTNTSTYYEYFNLTGTQTSTGWNLYSSGAGDVSGVSFSISTLTGQIMYTSTNITGYISSKIKYNANSIPL